MKVKTIKAFVRGVSVILHNEAITKGYPLSHISSRNRRSRARRRRRPRDPISNAAGTFSCVEFQTARVKSLLQSGERCSFSLPSMLLTTTACRRRSSGLAMKRSIMAEAPNAAAKQHTVRHRRRAAAAAAIAKETRPFLTDHACSACRAKTEPRHTM